MKRHFSFDAGGSAVTGLAWTAALCLICTAKTARADYSQDFNTGSATYTVNDPYWLDPNSANGFITQTTYNPAIWPGNPSAFSTDINQDVSGNGYFLFEGTYLYNGGTVIPTGNDEFFISPTFSVSPNTNYSVSFYLTNADTNGIAVASVQPQIDGTLLGSPVSAVGTWGSNGWQQFTFSWNSASNASASLILHDFTTTASGNDFGIDNISVSAVPEPASASLFLLGATGFLTRRHRAARGY
ncbi:MAG: PEP-CTERM sorting domain-containing protein [Tepidisphaeraceae bacterium]